MNKPAQLLAGRQDDCALVGMLHIAVNTILLGPPDWRAALGLPQPTAADYARIAAWGAENHPAELSFFAYVRDRMLREAAVYMRHGMAAMMLENVGAPYFVRDGTPAAITAVMRCLAADLRAAYPATPLGIQILAYGDHLALDVAVETDLDFVRGESLLFQGLRPEGPTPNQGNLAQFYLRREILQAGRGRAGSRPMVLVDILKKHTVFPGELADPRTWLDNIVFEKLEGVIVTGSHTGLPPDEALLAQARAAVDRAEQLLADLAGTAPGTARARLPLLVGSGVSAGNVAMVKRHASGAIVGTAFKQHNHWECLLDEERVQRFMDAWHGGCRSQP